ncbi:MAG: phosphatase PAP2 family protein [archaeon]
MKKRDLILLTIGFIVLVFSFFVDDAIAVNFQNLHTSWLTYFFSWITNIGSVFVILFIITSLFLYEEKKREWIPFLWLSFFTSIIVGYILKFLVARPRPYDVLHNVVALATETTYSFPSLHTMIAFAALPILDREFRQIHWFWIIFAVLVAFSRMYIGVHYLSDILAGAIMGYLIGWAYMKLELKEKWFVKWNLKRL